MTYFILAAKRLYRSLPFVISILLLLGAVTLGSLLGKETAVPGAGIVALGEGKETSALLALLAEQDFVLYENEETLRCAIARGDISCGAVLAPDMEARILSTELDGCIRFLYPADSILPELFRVSVVTGVLSVASPYFSTPILKELAPEVDLTEEIAARYQEEKQNGTGFVFDIETVAGNAPREEDFGERFALTLLSVMLFVLPLLQSCRLFRPEYRTLEKRIGRQTAYTTVFLPEVGISLFSTLAAIAVGIPSASLLADKPRLLAHMGSAVAAAILLSLFALALPLVIKRAESLQMLIVPVLLLTLVFCPLMIDISLLFPAARVIRLFLPTYWIFLL